ncbi:MAG: hypothetical protein EP349_00765 [Alphaproteobacteria bacterium]|nr:MAG: hypothetical protein EP349_00765 [Alphaproteobacteria bacterium]
MRHQSRLCYFLAVFFLVSCLGMSVAAACICARGSFNTRWQAADVIFRGTVKTITVDHPRHLNAYDDKPVEITFDVVGYFKGGSGKMTEFPLDLPVPLAGDEKEALTTGRYAVPEKDENKQFTMHTSLQNLTCMGYPFQEGQEYLVFAYLRKEGSGNRWSLYHYPAGTYGAGGLCGGTSLYVAPEARKDLQEIYKVLRNTDSRRGGLLSFPLND